MRPITPGRFGSPSLRSKEWPSTLLPLIGSLSVPAENSVRFYVALRKAKVPAEMHIFENGAHGVGLALDDPALSLWPTLLTNWLRGRGLLTKP